MEDLLDKASKKKRFFNWGYIAAFLLGVGVFLIGFLLIPKHDTNLFTTSTKGNSALPISPIAKSTDTTVQNDVPKATDKSVQEIVTEANHQTVKTPVANLVKETLMQATSIINNTISFTITRKFVHSHFVAKYTL